MTRRRLAFTLIELLVVITILGILAGLAVPALKNIGKANVTVSASRQLLDDIGRGRQLAMSQRTTVYMIFVPTNFWGNLAGTNLDSAATTNLLDKQLSGYTFIAQGAVGDQPGQRKNHWHYLAAWQSLDGSFIAAQKFAGTNTVQSYGVAQFNRTTVPIPFPTETSLGVTNLPYIAFNYLGQLTVDGVNKTFNAEYIPLAQGSVLPAIDPATKNPLLGPAQVSENPPGNSSSSSYNIVEVDPLTGRATLLFQQVQ